MYFVPKVNLAHQFQKRNIINCYNNSELTIDYIPVTILVANKQQTTVKNQKYQKRTETLNVEAMLLA
jgi:hypothetical protein